MDWAVKLRVALLALVGAFAVGVASSQATISGLRVDVVNLTSSSESASGSTLYYAATGTNSGSFDVKVTATSPVTSVDFPTVTGMTGGGVAVAGPCPCVMTYGWTASTTATGAQTVTVHDADPSQKTATFTVTPDVPTVKVTPPTEASGAGDQFFDPTTKTQWFRPNTTGSFTLNATVTDQVSLGGATVTFPDVSSVAGWASSTGGDDTASPFSSPVTYSWTAGAGAPGAKTVTATTVGGTATDSITISGDSAAPTGQAVTLAGGPWFGSSVSLAVAPGIDAGSGVDASRSVVERAAATTDQRRLRNLRRLRAGDAVGDQPIRRRPPEAATATRRRRPTTSATSRPRRRPRPTRRWTELRRRRRRSSSPASPTRPRRAAPSTSGRARPGRSRSLRPRRTHSPASPRTRSRPSPASRQWERGRTAPTSRPRRGRRRPARCSVTATNAAGLSSGVASFTLVPDATAPTLAVRCNGAVCKQHAVREDGHGHLLGDRSRAPAWTRSAGRPTEPSRRSTTATSTRERFLSSA